MKQALGTLAEGTVLKLYENGSLAEFIVAKQYSGYTMLVRRTILSEKRGWGLSGSSTNDQITWKNSTLKTWLEGTYASYLHNSAHQPALRENRTEYCSDLGGRGRQRNLHGARDRMEQDFQP